MLTELELRKLLHDPTELFTRAFQPALWLLVFGQVFTRIRAIPTGSFTCIEFMATGILAQSVLFVSIFYGVSLLWERDLGIVHKSLASPTPRAALVLGKALSAGLRSLVQAVIVYNLALLPGVKVDGNPLALLAAAAMIVLGASIFAAFSLIIACLVKPRERFMGIGQVLTMPLFFASNAIYPISVMPGWLQFLSTSNPLTYMVDALRTLMLVGAVSAFGLGPDFAVAPGATFVLVWIASRLYPRVAY